MTCCDDGSPATGRGDGGRGETADERLDHLIAMPRRARSTPLAKQPQLRHLTVVSEQSEGSAASRGGPQGDAAVNGDGARVGADVAALKDVPRPSHLPVDFLASCRKRMVCWHHWYMDEL